MPYLPGKTKIKQLIVSQNILFFHKHSTQANALQLIIVISLLYFVYYKHLNRGQLSLYLKRPPNKETLRETLKLTFVAFLNV